MIVRTLLAVMLSACTLPSVAPLAAQTTAGSTHPHQAPGSQPRAAKRPLSAALRPYTNCKVTGGPDLVETAQLPQVPMVRAAQTLTGPKKITIADGVLAAYAYKPGVPFANVKIELLPAASYSAQKADLISEFDAINAKGENTQRNYDLKAKVNGFEIYGFDRKALRPEDQVLGIYLFFDNGRHVATTAYFLNAPEGQRNFKTVEDYNAARSSFIDGYTSCVRRTMGGSAKSTSSSLSKAGAHETTGKPARH